ncbi:MAG: hypothetical protein LBQ69_05240 [Treponema sp.]|jgi:hypothetical protein|nr:hypothetical protein [Treponema sp.]
MDLEALFKIVHSWGPSAVTSLLVFFVIHLAKKLDKNNEDDKKRADNLQGYLDDKLKEFREGNAKTLDEHGRRLSYIEMEYIKRETFYRELGGWKDDINRLSGQISEVGKNIIELWKDKTQ